MGAYSVKYGNKSLEDKNNSNKIILIGFFLKDKEDFPFLDVQKGDRSHLTIPKLLVWFEQLFTLQCFSKPR